MARGAGSRATVIVSLAAACLILAAPKPEQAKRWWTDVYTLAGDEMNGRETGSPEHHLAAVYVAREFRRAGLKPAGTKGYMQPVELQVRQLVESDCRLALVTGAGRVNLRLGEDAIFLARGFRPRTALAARAVFVGYGLSVPEAGHDDLANLDVRNKFAVFIGGGPATLPGPVRAHAQSAAERWRALREAGAAGMISILNPKAMEVPWERIAARRLQPAMTLADPRLEETPGLDFAITVNPAYAEKFFAGSGHTFQEIASLAAQEKPLPRFPLAVTVDAAVQADTFRTRSENVAAIFPGSEPSLRDEYVVLSAHLDHLGPAATADGTAIHRGVMDNASGVATLLEVARELEESGRGTRRSVLFLAVTGEEKGLLGSKYFAAYPTVPPSSIVADLNVDMFLPIHPLRILTAIGGEESDLGDQARAAAETSGVQSAPDPEPMRNRFIRSDQYSFIRRGIPSLALKFGYEKGSPEEALQKEWLRTRYHAVADDLQQPVDLDAVVRFNAILLTLAERVANTTERPRWKPGSFFRRYAQ